MVMGKGAGDEDYCLYLAAEINLIRWVGNAHKPNAGCFRQRAPECHTWLRSVPSPVTAVWDIAAVLESGGVSVPTGKWVCPSGVASTNDGLHANSADATLGSTAVNLGVVGL